jgi:hypothetical protein
MAEIEVKLIEVVPIQKVSKSEKFNQLVSKLDGNILFDILVDTLKRVIERTLEDPSSAYKAGLIKQIEVTSHRFQFTIVIDEIHRNFLKKLSVPRLCNRIMETQDVALQGFVQI